MNGGVLSLELKQLLKLLPCQLLHPHQLYHPASDLYQGMSSDVSQSDLCSHVEVCRHAYTHTTCPVISHFVHGMVLTVAAQGWMFPDKKRLSEQSKGCCVAPHWTALLKTLRYDHDAQKTLRDRGGNDLRSVFPSQYIHVQPRPASTSRDHQLSACENKKITI